MKLLWDLLLVGLLLAIERHVRVRPGGLFVLFIGGYSFGRIFEELFFRIDPAHELFGLRLNFFVATALFVASASFLVLWRRRQPEQEPGSQRAADQTPEPAKAR